MCPKPSPRCVSIKLFYFTRESRIFRNPPPTPLAVLGQTHLKNTLAAGVYVFPRAVGHPSPRLADPLPVRQKQAAAYNTIIPNKSTFAVHCNF